MVFFNEENKIDSICSKKFKHFKEKAWKSYL